MSTMLVKITEKNVEKIKEESLDYTEKTGLTKSAKNLINEIITEYYEKKSEKLGGITDE